MGNLKRRIRGDDRGSVLVIAVILCAVLASVGPLVVSNLSSNGPLVLRTANEHAALAAAEAGVEWYHNAIDGNPAYVGYSSGDNPVNDPAFGGWCSASCDLSGTNPAEAFHYTPNGSDLSNLSGTDAGEMLLVVSGRGGQPGNYDYITVQAAFTRSSILDNVYFTQYEIIDPQDNFPSTLATITECAPSAVSGTSCTCPSSGPTTCSYPPLYGSSSPSVSYTYTTTSGTQQSVSNEGLWYALCEYDNWQPNNFIDSIGLPVIADGNKAASSSFPFYGTYDQIDTNTGAPFEGQFIYQESPSVSIEIPANACGTPHTFVGSEVFNGPAYSNDQIVVGGTPFFDGGTTTNAPYTSGASYSTTFTWDVPDSVPVTSANDNNNPYPPTSLGLWAPRGTTVAPNAAASSDGATFGPNRTTPLLGGNEALPAFSTLESFAASSTNGGGCVFTGPTMIEIVAPTSGTGPSTMDVWSPLSSSAASANVTTPTTAACSGVSGNAISPTPTSFSTSTPFITGIPLPANGVVYVEGYAPLNSTPLSSCFNPLQSNALYTTASTTYPESQCYEGDAYVGGELSGQLTIGSSANMVIARPLTYACVDNSSPVVTSPELNITLPSSVTACKTSGTEDVLGLDSANDVLLSLPQSSSSYVTCGSSTPSGSWTGSNAWNGTGSPPNTPSPGNVTVLGATVAEPGAIWPDCDLAYPTNGSYTGLAVDAAIVAHVGSLATQNYAAGPSSSWALYLNGADVSRFRGSFGNGNQGYSKQFSYDSRLAFIEPPDLLAASVAVWKNLGFVECAGGDTEYETTVTCPSIS